MEPAIVVALLWVLSGGTHVGLASRRVREPLVAALGELGFFGLFSLVATLTFWALIAYYAGHRFDGVAKGADAVHHEVRHSQVLPGDLRVRVQR